MQGHSNRNDLNGFVDWSDWKDDDCNPYFTVHYRASGKKIKEEQAPEDKESPLVLSK